MAAPTPSWQPAVAQVVIQGNRRIEADNYWFNVDPNTNDLQQARAVDDVVFDGIADDGGRLHATGDNGVYDGATGVLTVTSNPGSRVVALQTPKEGDRPNGILRDGRSPTTCERKRTT